jgi:hypothetical protein
VSSASYASPWHTESDRPARITRPRAMTAAPRGGSEKVDLQLGR